MPDPDLLLVRRTAAGDVRALEEGYLALLEASSEPALQAHPRVMSAGDADGRR